MKKKNLIVSSIVLAQTVITAPVATTLANTNEGEQQINDDLTFIPFKTDIEVTGNLAQPPANINILDDQYDFTVNRDYNQEITFNVKNNGNVDAHVYYRAVDKYTDIELGFTNVNSPATAFPILVDEEQELPFKVFMQNAEQTEYEFTVEAVDAKTNQVVDSANVKINLTDYKFDFDAKLTPTDDSGIQMLEILNKGDRVPDLTIKADGALKNVVSFAPAVTNAILEKDASLNVAVIPNYELLKERSYSGNLIAVSGGMEIKIPITFEQYKDPLIEVTTEDILAEYQKQQQEQDAAIYEEVSEKLDISGTEKQPFSMEGGETVLKIASRESGENAFEAQYTIKAEPSVEGTVIPEEGYTFSEKTEETGQIIRTLTAYVTAQQYAEMLGLPQTRALDPGLSFTITLVETLPGIGRIPKVSVINDMSTFEGTLTNLDKLQYYNSNKVNVPAGQLVVYNFVNGINTLASAATFVNIPQIKVGGAAISYFTSFLMTALESDMGEYPGLFDQLSLRLQTLISQCINRRQLKNEFNIPFSGSNINYSGNGFLTVKNHPQRNGNYADETFTYHINDQLIDKKENVTPNQLNFLEFDPSTIKDGVIRYKQTNSHKNRQHYVIETDVEVYLPIDNDSKFLVPSPDDLLDYIVPVSPDYALSKDFAKFDGSYLVEGQTRNFTFSVFNEGLQDGSIPVPVSVYVNGQLILEKSYTLARGEKKDITVPIDLTAPNVEIKVVVDEKNQHFELDEKDNTFKLNYKVLENDGTGPQIKLLTPAKDTQINYVTAEIEDLLGVKKVEFKVNGRTVKHNVQNSKYSAILPQPLPIGRHYVEIIATDFGGNTSTISHQLEVIADNDISLRFTDALFEVRENLTNDFEFNLAEALSLKIADKELAYTDYYKDLEIEFFLKNNQRFYNYGHRLGTGYYYFYDITKEEDITALVTYKGQTATAKIKLIPKPAKELAVGHIPYKDHLNVRFSGMISDYRLTYLSQSYISRRSNPPITSVRLSEQHLQEFSTIMVDLNGPNVLAQFELTQEDIKNQKLNPTLHEVTFTGFTENKNVAVKNTKTNRSISSYDVDSILLTSGNYEISVVDKGALYKYNVTINADSVIKRDIAHTQDKAKLTLGIPAGLTLVNGALEIHTNNASQYVQSNNTVFETFKSPNASISYELQNNRYKYRLTSNFAIEEDVKFTIPSSFATMATLPESTVTAGTHLNYYGVNLVTDDASTVSSIIDVSTNKEIPYVAKYINKDDRTKTYEFEFEQYDNSIPTPPESGNYTLLIYPDVEQVDSGGGQKVRPDVSGNWTDWRNIKGPVANDYSWTIKLNDQVDAATVNTNNIFVVDQDGYLVEGMAVTAMDKQISVIAPTTGYKKNQTYVLYVRNNLKNKDGELLNMNIKMQFTTK